ncbi:Putative E3 ubiquitin-protein ligase UBR7 [Sarcoptes scabiei]|nr:Putative E3 ubiquitin-protein ligase UBR7 [Sarcoptes scabiei]
MDPKTIETNPNKRASSDEEKEKNDEKRLKKTDETGTTTETKQYSPQELLEEDEEIDLVEYLDIINDDIDRNEMAEALLGGVHENLCTMLLTEGESTRQALYACLTCSETVGNGEPAGICLPCSEECHKDHELFELYSKRDFVCDCGNPKFGDLKCKLFPKIYKNEGNKYNQNFKGLYCTCHKPYTFEDEEMFQCLICEDWFHVSHLNHSPPEEWTEMVCEACVSKHEFMFFYDESGILKSDKNLEVEEYLNYLKQNPKRKKIQECIYDPLKQSVQSKLDFDEIKQAHTKHFKTIYLPIDWRTKICNCFDCTKMYQDQGLAFILDPFDMVCLFMYKNQQIEDKPLAKYQNNHVRTIQVVDEIKKFFQICTQQKRAVTTEDIRDILDNINKNNPALKRKF